jgi:hypothetical protein
VGGITKLLDYIAAERRLHNAVSKIAGFNLGSAGGSPIGALLHPGFGIKHGEAFMMFAGEGEHLHAAFVE